MNDFYSSIKLDLKGIKGAINKIRKFVWASIYYYDADRVFSKILLLEVRNFPGYFESETYQIVKEYAGFLLSIIEDGIQSGSLRDDIAPSTIRQFILGTIEHHCLPAIIFDREIDNDKLADNLSEIIFYGIVKNK
jgi:TetR/AcrR family fatty acid metabolism transcriptional regulator